MAHRRHTLLLRLMLLSHVVSGSLAYELKGLRLIANLISGKLLETTLDPDQLDENATDEPTQSTFSIGNSSNDFLTFVSHADRRRCGLHDAGLAVYDPNTDGPLPTGGGFAGGRRQPTNPKAPVRLQCRRGHGNGTMLMINSYKDMWHLIAPHGNATGKQYRKQEPGNCALLLFYSKTCYMSSKLAPQFNPLPHLFPDLRVGAIDAVRFHELNTELGIVGLPTLILFHQAHSEVRYNGTLSRVSPNFQTISDFVTEHTGIPSRLRAAATSAEDTDGGGMFALRSEHFEGPLDGVLVVESDWCLWLAWVFIAVCGAHCFVRSRTYAAVVEYVKRNWRESVAQHERIAVR